MRTSTPDEYLRAFKELWTSEHPTFEGQYGRFAHINFLPRPVQQPHPPIWVGGESPGALRRTAALANGWYPIGSNPRFSMEPPAQLATGIEPLAAYAREAGRNAAELDIVCCAHDYAVHGDGHTTAGPSHRHPFVGTADEIAMDIRQYAGLGVGDLVVDLARMSRTLEEMLQHMEAMATQVWPRVEAGEEWSRVALHTIPMIHHISAVTFAVRSMPEAIAFYGQLGFTVVYGGPQARFSTLQAGTAFVNLSLLAGYLPVWWGRTIFRVDDVDALYQSVLAAGYAPTPPQNGAWGERYFHLTDPNGHELSFAQLLT